MSSMFNRQQILMQLKINGRGDMIARIIGRVSKELDVRDRKHQDIQDFWLWRLHKLSCWKRRHKSARSSSTPGICSILSSSFCVSCSEVSPASSSMLPVPPLSSDDSLLGDTCYCTMPRKPSPEVTGGRLKSPIGKLTSAIGGASGIRISPWKISMWT